MTVIGVDVSVRRGLDIVQMDKRANVVRAWERATPEVLSEILTASKVHCVAIDSPPGPASAPGASARRGELALRRLGITCFSTPSDPLAFAAPFYDWVRVGMQVFAAAEAAGFGLLTDPGRVRGAALEVFPHASDVCLRGHLPPPGTTGRVVTNRAWRLSTLLQAGVGHTDRLCTNRNGDPTLDSIDAALAALTALRALAGDFTALGAPGEFVVVPGADHERFARRDLMSPASTSIGETSTVIIRRERPDDVEAATRIESRAFHQPGRDGDGHPIEVDLLNALRDDPGWIPELSLVAEIDSRVVGHAVCTRGHVGTTPVVALGPIGVEPDSQRSGIGHALMHAMVGAADALGEPLIALLGSTDYYPRFGFVPGTSVGVDPPEPLWGDHFQVRKLTAHDETVVGTFRYAAPFDDLP